SAWLAAKHALPVMRQHATGSIVNISSLAAWEAYPLVGYKTMKAALLALTQHLAAGNARYGVRVNAILPGLMNTPMAIEARVAQGTSRDQVIAARNKRVPLRHTMGTAWDVAYAALFLHSDEAGFISGALLPVDGGATATCGTSQQSAPAPAQPGQPTQTGQGAAQPGQPTQAGQPGGQAAAQPTAAAAAQQAAAQQAPAAGGQKVSLRWFFWTGTEEERQFW